MTVPVGHRPDRDASDGFLGGLDALAFGALVLITGTLLILNAWSVVDTRMAVSAAAREAVRTIVEAPPDLLLLHEGVAAVEAAARDRALVTLREHGKDTSGVVDADLVFRALSSTPRCDWAEVAITFRAPTIALPFVGGFRTGIPVTVGHRERIDPFRSGLAGEVDCA